MCCKPLLALYGMTLHTRDGLSWWESRWAFHLSPITWHHWLDLLKLYLKWFLCTILTRNTCSPVCSKRTTQVHVKVLQVFESDGCLYVHKEYPQRDGGQADTPLWKTKQEEDFTGGHQTLTFSLRSNGHIITKHKGLTCCLPGRNKLRRFYH